MVHAKKMSPSCNLAVRDLVMVEEANCPPLYWPLGCVFSVVCGMDGQVRHGAIKTGRGTIDHAPYQNVFGSIDCACYLCHVSKFEQTACK